MEKKELEQVKVAIADTFSDFYTDVIKKRFDYIDHEITDLRLTSETLVKIVDYSRLESKVIELEGRIKSLEKKSL